MMGWGNQGYGMGGFGGIVMILFWVIIIIGIVVLIRYLIPGQGQGKLLAAKRDPL